MVCLFSLLRQAVQQGASDLHLTVDQVPIVRLHGQLLRQEGPELNNADMEQIWQRIATTAEQEVLESQGDVSLMLSNADGRFRIHAYRQRGCLSLAIRLLPSVIPPLSALGLPPAVSQLCQKQQGLILVVGPAGSGKSTTLASMVDEINRTQSVHIITIEDPVEFLHEHQCSLVHQREVGVDTPSYAQGLLAALREDPDVIVIGEMRDADTMAAAVTAAETGHLVMTSLHTAGAVQVVDRILDVFPAHQQRQVRTQLALSLQAIIGQRLLPRADGQGRVLAAELLLATPAVRHLIREDKIHQIPSLMQMGGEVGMQTMRQSIQSLQRSGLIGPELYRWVLAETANHDY